MNATVTRSMSIRACFVHIYQCLLEPNKYCCPTFLNLYTAISCRYIILMFHSTAILCAASSGTSEADTCSSTCIRHHTMNSCQFPKNPSKNLPVELRSLIVFSILLRASYKLRMVIALLVLQCVIKLL